MHLRREYVVFVITIGLASITKLHEQCPLFNPLETPFAHYNADECLIAKNMKEKKGCVDEKEYKNLKARIT